MDPFKAPDRRAVRADELEALSDASAPSSSATTDDPARTAFRFERDTRISAIETRLSRSVSVRLLDRFNCKHLPNGF